MFSPLVIKYDKKQGSSTKVKPKILQASCESKYFNNKRKKADVKMKLKKTKKQVSSSRDVFYDFGQWVSGHGYRRIIQADSLVGRIIWGVITGICTVLFIVQCARVLRLYLEYPTSVTTHR